MSSLYLKAWDSKTFSDFKIRCDLFKREALFQLEISFTISGPIQDLKGIPTENSLNLDTPTQFHETLWKSSCLEVFLGLEDSPEYWEWNLSPNLKEYACFGFSKERKREASLRSHSNFLKPFDLNYRRLSLQEVTFSWKMDFSFWSLALWKKDFHPSQIKLGLNAILEKHDGEQSFWALDHGNNTRPDFHLNTNRNCNW